MIISERNLLSTCGFIVAKYERGISEDIEGKLYLESRSNLGGLSLLLVGFREKKHIDEAISRIDWIKQNQLKKSGAASQVTFTH